MDKMQIRIVYELACEAALDIKHVDCDELLTLANEQEDALETFYNEYIKE